MIEKSERDDARKRFFHEAMRYLGFLEATALEDLPFKERMSIFVDIGACLTKLNILKDTDPDVDAGAAVRKYAAAFAANASSGGQKRPGTKPKSGPRLVRSRDTDDDTAG
jgi:hypothetical protein